jgi:hypothetical protein
MYPAGVVIVPDDEPQEHEGRITLTFPNSHYYKYCTTLSPVFCFSSFSQLKGKESLKLCAD